MKAKYVLSIIVFLIILSCGGGGSDSNDQDIPPAANKKIQNPIRENSVPVGLSSFAVGVEAKFPYSDTDLPGFISIAETVRNIATNELYTFPESPNQEKIIQVLQQLVNDGHNVTHEIHILNGPGMRKSQDRWINSIVGRNVSDEEFSNLLQHNQMVKDSILNLFSEVVSYARTLESLGIEVLICPELEDNQDNGSNGGFGVYLQFLEQLGWERSKIVRNGGKVGETPGIRYESHNPANINSLRPGDILNTDGTSFSFNSDIEKPNYLFSESQVRAFQAECETRGIIFYLWYAPLQGLTQVAPFSYVPYPEYTNRNYKLGNPTALTSILLNIREEEVIYKE